MVHRDPTRWWGDVPVGVSEESTPRPPRPIPRSRSPSATGKVPDPLPATIVLEGRGRSRVRTPVPPSWCGTSRRATDHRESLVLPLLSPLERWRDLGIILLQWETTVYLTPNTLNDRNHTSKSFTRPTQPPPRTETVVNLYSNLWSRRSLAPTVYHGGSRSQKRDILPVFMRLVRLSIFRV